MIYSCFDAEQGDYRVFEDDGARAINADLDVPKFSSPTKIGMPATEAGRQLPAGASQVGRSWSAQGIVVSCGKKRALGADLPTPSTTELVVLFTGAALGFLLLQYLRDER